MNLNKLHALVLGFSLAFCTIGINVRANPNDGTPASITTDIKKTSVYQLGVGKGGLLFIGTVHTFDPKDEQIREMAILFDRFKPDIVLIEGGDWKPLTTVDETVSKLGEMAYAHQLSRARNIVTEDADPPIASEIKHVLAHFDAEAVKLYYVLRLVPLMRDAKSNESLDERLVHALASQDFEGISELQNTLTTLRDFEAAVKKRLPTLGDWRNIGNEWLGLDSKKSFLSEVLKRSLDYRDRYTTKRLVELLRQQKKVLVVQGLAHLDAQRELLIPALMQK